MNTRVALFVRAIRDPILLIVIGALFAIQQAGFLPVSRTWPLLIIVIGFLKLIERLAAPRPPYPNPNWGAPSR
jgi:uncharacterized membrane protein